MSYTDNDFVKLSDCYELAVKCKSFLSSTKSLRGGWENMTLRGTDERYTINGVPRKAFVVRSYGVPIAAKVPIISDGTMKWLINSNSYSTTTTKHVRGIMRAVWVYYLEPEDKLKELLEN